MQPSEANPHAGQVKVITNANGRLVADRSEIPYNQHLQVKQEKTIRPGTIKIVQTTAHSLGVLTHDPKAGLYYDEVIIPPNHKQPARDARRFRVHSTSVDIYVLQGIAHTEEDSDGKELTGCQIVSKYTVSGINSGGTGASKSRLFAHARPSTVPDEGAVLRIMYIYDRNGIIQVCARQDDSDTDLPVQKTKATDEEKRAFNELAAGGSVTGEADSTFGEAGGEWNVADKYTEVTFSNVQWERYDNIAFHPRNEYPDPPVPVEASEKTIAFRGYHKSEMNEGVRYMIGSSDSFFIECDVNTSTISPHPGGYLEISLGPISAQIHKEGGNMLLSGSPAKQVGSRFHLRMDKVGVDEYKLSVDGIDVGTARMDSAGRDVEVRFGFRHESHSCYERSDATLSNIQMGVKKDAATGNGSSDSATDIWDCATHTANIWPMA